MDVTETEQLSSRLQRKHTWQDAEETPATVAAHHDEPVWVVATLILRSVPEGSK